jgi:putative chitinase
VLKKKPDDYVSKDTALANYVYADRMGNGNVESGDGFKYRGRGIFQLTGKTNYTNFKTWYNNKYDPDKDFVDKPELLKDNDTMAILSAMWYYKTEVLDRITVDSTATVKKVTEKINGGKNGLPDREARFTKAKDSIKCN